MRTYDKKVSLEEMTRNAKGSEWPYVKKEELEEFVAQVKTELNVDLIFTVLIRPYYEYREFYIKVPLGYRDFIHTLGHTLWFLNNPTRTRFSKTIHLQWVELFYAETEEDDFLWDEVVSHSWTLEEGKNLMRACGDITLMYSGSEQMEELFSAIESFKRFYGLYSYLRNIKEKGYEIYDPIGDDDGDSFPY